MSTIKEILKPANKARDIVLNVGANTTTEPNAAYSELEFQAGFYWPMVKVRNTTFTKPNVKLFEVSFGYNLIPTLEFKVIDDSKSFQQTDYPVKNDIVTIYFGNQYDQNSKPIQLDFLIDDVTSIDKTSGTPEHFFQCSLAIESQFENMNFAAEMDSIGVLMELCKKMKLGFVTNLNTTDDFQKYRQYSKTNIDFLKDVCSKVYVDDKSIIHYFIDQYFRLNVIDINQVLMEVADASEVSRDVTFFKVLEKPEKLILNNSQFDLTNVQFKFNKYRQENKAFDSYKEVKPIESTVIVKDYSTATVKSSVKNTKNKTVKGGTTRDITANNVTESKQVQSISVKGEDNANVKQVGNNANKSRYTYLNNNAIIVRMNTPSNLLNINQLVPVKLYNSDQFSVRPYKNSDKNLDSTMEVPSFDGSETVNESLSSDYAIHAMSFAYRDGQDLWQELKLVRKEWKKQFYDDDGLELIDLSDTTFGAPQPYTIPDTPPPPAIDNSGLGGGGYGGQLGNWMQIARGELGTREVAGSGSNPRIEEYHKVGGGLTGSNVNDSVAWCGSFVGWCMVKAGYTKASGAAAAISWATYGTACAPGTIGAIIVLKLKPSSMTYSGNHVGFCAGLNGNKVSILGGNQGDSVSQVNMDAGKVIAWRLPPGSPSAGIAAAGNSVAPTGPLRISPAGINFIKNREGCKLTAYQDSGGVWTIGYGNTKQARPGMTITYQQAEQLLRNDIVYFENYINKNIKVKVTQVMFDALVSLIFNTGPGKASPSSKIGQLMAARQYAAAADAFLQYITAKGKRLEGLVSRRQAERQMFLSQGVNPI